MKLFLSIVLIINTLFINSAYADDINKMPSWATSFSTRGLFFRNSLSDKHSLFYGIQYSLYNYKSQTSNDKDEYIDVEIGHRYYFKKSNIQSFVDSSVAYTFTKGSRVNKTKYYSLNFLYGLEHFLVSNFSVEGAAGLALRYSDYGDKTNSTNVFGPVAKVAVNYYF